jgi:hypothetical protein
VLRGLGQALVMALGGAAVAFAAGGVWTALADGRYLSRVGLSMILVAGLLALVGGSLPARLETSETRAFLGMGPERDQADLGGSLGPMGVFLFVCVPLAVVGLVLLG